MKTYCFKLYRAKRNKKLHRSINIAGSIYEKFSQKAHDFSRGSTSTFKQNLFMLWFCQ